MPLELVALWKNVSALGLPFAIFLAMLANQRGWWVWKREMDLLQFRIQELETRIGFLEEEKRDFKEVAVYGQRSAARAVRVAKRAVSS